VGVGFAESEFASEWLLVVLTRTVPMAVGRNMAKRSLKPERR
jgi:hypothetical protein